MTLELEYPLFIPPVQYIDSPAREWSRSKADEYKEWMLNVLPDRVENFLSFIEVPRHGSPSEHLAKVGVNCSKILASTPFSDSELGRQCLSNAGYAMASDVGLLVADYLVTALGRKIQWEVCRVRKREVSFNLPVLTGFKFGYLDPIRGSIGEAFAVINGIRGPGAWRIMFEQWVADV